MRQYSQGADGTWTVISHGTGTNVWPVVGPTIDNANQAIGPLTFDIVDAQMFVYIAVDQLLH